LTHNFKKEKMKKIYTLVIALLSAASFAQTPFFDVVPYKGAFPVTDGLTGITSNDWTAGWTEWDAVNKTYPAVDSIINGNITSSRTLSPLRTYQLVGNIAVTNGATLTILPGTVIRGDLASKSCLIISRGSKINAQGTKTLPIVFTSNEAAGNRGPGDWGGLVLLGSGVTNTACATCSTVPNENYIEGFQTTFPEIIYGGTNNADNSGTLKYIRIEFAGVALSATPNSELNSLTMGGVGSGTTLDYIQAIFGGDDGFEWFGGAVNAKHLIVYRGLDDDFDTDFGWNGHVQYGLVVRDADISDSAGDSNGFESDNYNPGVGRSPITKGVFSNITCVGPKRDGSLTLPIPNYFSKSLRIRRNSAISVFNSLFIGWGRGLSVESSSTQDNFSATSPDSMAVYGYNNSAVGMPAVFTGSGQAFSFYSGFWATKGNDSTQTAAQINWVNPFPTALETMPDFRLNLTSTVGSGANFSDPRLAGLLVGVNSLDRSNSSSVVYPNPASSEVNISINLMVSENVSIKLYDITGKLLNTTLLNEKVNSGISTYKINTSELNSGLYIIKISSDSMNNSVKVIVNN